MELETAKASLSEELEQEQTNVSNHMRTISQNEACIAELRKQIEQVGQAANALGLAGTVEWLSP